MNIPETKNKGAVIRGLAISLMINALAPWLIYMALTNYTHVSDIFALFATGIPSVIDSIVGIVRRRRIDFMAGLALLSIVMSLIFIALGGSPRLYLVRGSLFGMAISLLALVSFVFPKPLTYYTARYFMTGNDEQRMAAYEKKWQQDMSWRWMLRIQALIWGIGMLLEGVVRIWLVFSLSVSQFLIVSPFVFYGFYGALLLLSMVCGAIFRYRQEKRSQREKQAQSDL